MCANILFCKEFPCDMSPVRSIYKRIIISKARGASQRTDGRLTWWWLKSLCGRSWGLTAACCAGAAGATAVVVIHVFATLPRWTPPVVLCRCSANIDGVRLPWCSRGACRTANLGLNVQRAPRRRAHGLSTAILMCVSTLSWLLVAPSRRASSGT